MIAKFFLSLIVFFLLSKMSPCQDNNKKAIKLKSDCFWENKKRKVIDTLINKTALISREKENYILMIDKKKYFACNLPDKLKGNKIIISGLVYQGLATEKLIGTPLKLTKACY